jgi:choline dehydrogenase-like flavoprotein
MKYDFAVIGSGVSGGRIAFELASKGASVIVLEAGKRFEAPHFPQNEALASVQLYWNGGLEVSRDGRLGFLRGKCVGGTSIVNQALLDRFDAFAWEDWEDRTGIDWMTTASMTPFYEAVEASLNLSTIPEKFWNANAKLFIRAFDELGYGWKALRRAQGDCALEEGTDCIVCLGGCPRNSKQSSLITTLAWAEQKHGAKIESEWEALRLEHRPDGVTLHGRQRGQQKTVEADRIVLAAGALGNTGILLKSGLQKYLPALGHSFTCHPQFMTYGLFDQDARDLIDAHKGAFQTVKSDDPKLRRAGYKFENVYAPPISTAMLFDGYGSKHLERMKKYRSYASMEVALRDDAEGVIRLQGDKLSIEKRLTYDDHRRAAEGLEIVQEMFSTIGAREIISCKQGFGLHLMGGCPIGNDSRVSVVNPDFQVHGFPRLLVADSSIFPSAPGINPSLTIMALSIKAARKALGDAGAR